MMGNLREPRRVMGYTDIGPIMIPPRPKKPALVDRANGNTYEITKSGSSPALSILSDSTGYEVFLAWSGPYVQAGAVTRRLYASGGTLGSEAVAFSAGSPPVLITVTASPLDVWSVVWDSSTLALTLEELL